MALDTTQGGLTTDSYVTLADANTWFGNRPDATNWTLENGSATRTDAQREALLRAATRDLDGYFESCGVRRVLDTGYFRSALVYPFWGYCWGSEHGEGHYRPITAETGSSTTLAVCASLQYSRTNQYVGGSLYVSQTTDFGVPIYEIKPISAYNASTYTVTVSSAFSATLTAGDQITIVMPVPAWLKEATLLQAIWIGQRSSGSSNHFNAGITSESSQTGESRTYRATGPGSQLHIDVKRICDAHMPRALVLER